jgi:hypothetical protein
MPLASSDGARFSALSTPYFRGNGPEDSPVLSITPAFRGPHCRSFALRDILFISGRDSALRQQRRRTRGFAHLPRAGGRAHHHSTTKEIAEMAIELAEIADGKTLEVKISGKLTSEDYSHFVPKVDALIENQGKIKFLFIMHDFHGWEIGAVWEDIKFDTTHFSKIDKIAMVGEKVWEKWMSVICKPFTTSSIKYFDASEIDAARQWLAE